MSSGEAHIIEGKQLLNYSANDWFYMNPQTCGTVDCEQPQNINNSCCLNKSAVDKLKTVSNELGSSMTQYNDARMLYNRELLFMVNIVVGLGLLCYYIYLNQSVLPNPMAAIGSLSSKLTMRPNISVASPAVLK